MSKGSFTFKSICLFATIAGVICWSFFGRSPLFSVLNPLGLRQASVVSITIDAGHRFQTIEGFGTAIAYWVDAPYNEPGWTKMYFQDLGSSMLRIDLNLNALRGPHDDLATPVVMSDDIDANIRQFNFHYPPIERMGRVVAASKSEALDEFKLIGSIWSPPNWMKGPELTATTGKPDGKMPQLGGPGGADSLGGSLIDTPENLQQFGRYVAAYVKGFQQTYGVPFYAISIQNELAFRESYNSCVYTPSLYVKAVDAVAAAFNEYGITTKIEGPEDVGVGSSDDPAILARQMSFIDAVNADPIAKNALSIYSIHGYANDGATPSRSPAMWAEYWSKIKTDGKESWMTETSGEPQSIKGAMRLANNAMDALVQGNVNAWLYWLPGKQGSNGTDTLTSDVNTTSQKYNAAKAFFRCIRPGAVRVSATPSDPDGVYVGAFVHDANKTLTVVVINNATSERTVNLSGLVGQLQVGRETTSDKSWFEITPASSNEKTKITLPSESILTLQTKQ